MPSTNQSASPPKDPSASIARSLDLARQMVPDAIDPRDVVEVIDQLGVDYVLIGGHAVSILLDNPRATVDVDLVVSADKASSVAAALAQRFPDFVVHDFRDEGRGDNVRLAVRGAEDDKNGDRIDVIAANGVFGLSLKHRQAVGKGRSRIYLPTIESALGLKYAAGSSPYRESADKAKDRFDFMSLARSVVDRQLDLPVLREYGLVVIPGCGDYEIELAVGKALRGLMPF